MTYENDVVMQDQEITPYIEGYFHQNVVKGPKFKKTYFHYERRYAKKREI